MNRLVALVTRIFVPRTPAPPPKPWEDPNRSEADRQAWIKAEPKSLKGKAA